MNPTPHEPAGDYTIIIPAYNEERRIGPLLGSLAGFPGIFLVICDGNDGTPDLVKRFASENPGVRISACRYDHRLGKGGAIKEGFTLAGTPRVGYMDADGSTSIEQMTRLLDGLDHADGVIGSRWLPDSVITVPQGFSRKVQSRIFNLLIRALFGLSFRDTQCGAKVFKKEAIDAVLEKMTSTGFEFDVELLWRLESAGYRVRECPITWTNRDESRLRGGEGFGMFTALMRLRWKG
ncbi:glycosyltransferase involved in cell wall biosynthesis [Methanolinea mesophila]|uniref:dolichyl-phosphate beta-glucosyltransferase n=1 Tax=Methanolinea mesophila TaxID=547055 RepID=UPI001AE81470|nr:dolichyl-phosphate beta-glucosyltransferase [Methanolinea mesophila]MBP1929557.1 glycosyltransferase involved in cell wall biosynthesis [Methanolinea mesophila]